MSSERATAWSVTINNPTDADEEHIRVARQKGWKVEGQLEVGKSGTPHYQLMIKTPQVRFSALKAAFPRAHVEVCRNKAALEVYVNKEDTRAGQLAENSKLYPSLQTLWDMWYIHEVSLYQSLDLSLTEGQLQTKFEKFVAYKIREGYCIESIAVNPSTISQVKKYGFSILLRSQVRLSKKTDADKLDRQTTDMTE